MDGKYIEKLAVQSCGQVRAKIIAHGDQHQQQASYFILHMAITPIMPLLLCMMCRLIQLHGLPNALRKRKVLTGRYAFKYFRPCKNSGITIGQIIMDCDTSANAIVCSQLLDNHKAYCSNKHFIVI